MRRQLFLVWGLALLLTTVLVCSVQAQPAQRFTDVQLGDIYSPYINYLTGQGIISGFPDGSFHPYEGLTRAQVAALIVKSAGLQVQAGEESSFSDVPSSHWAAGSIAAGARAGYLKGFPDGSFRPDEKLTRAQGITLALIISNQVMEAPALPVLEDVNNQHWAAQSIAIGLAAEMVAPSADKKLFYPDAEFSRADMARSLAIVLTRDPQLNQRTLNGTVKAVSGEVKILKPKADNEVDARKGMTVSMGDKIRTGAGARMEISYPDGSSVLIKEKAEISVKETRGRSYMKQSGEPGIAVDWLLIDLKKGTIFGALATRPETEQKSDQEASPPEKKTTLNKKLSGLLASRTDFTSLAANTSSPKKTQWYQTAQQKKVKVKVDMPWGVAAIRGTFVRISVREDGRCEVGCLTGSAELSNEQGSVELSGGQHSELTGADTSPQPGTGLTADESTDYEAESEWAENTAGNMDDNQEMTPPPPPPATGNPATPTTGTTPTPPGAQNSTSATVNSALQQTTQGSQSSQIPGAQSSSSGGSSSGGGGGSPAVTIVRIDDINLTTVEGDFELPGKVQAVMSNGSTQEVSVTWDEAHPNTDTPGIVIFNGNVQGYSGTVKLTLMVERKLGVPALLVQGQPMKFAGGIQIDLGSYPIPSGATVTVNELSSAEFNLAGAGFSSGGKIVDITFQGIANPPGTLTLPLTPDVNSSKAGIYTYNGENWEYVESQLTNGKLQTSLLHFSTYGVLLDNLPPGNLTINLISQTAGSLELQFSGTDNSGIDQFEVYRKTGTEEYVLITKVKTPFIFNDANLLAGTSYDYCIRAVDYFGNMSDLSTAFTVSTGVIESLSICLVGGSPAPAIIPLVPSQEEPILLQLEARNQENQVLGAGQVNWTLSEYPQGVSLDNEQLGLLIINPGSNPGTAIVQVSLISQPEITGQITFSLENQSSVEPQNAGFDLDNLNPTDLTFNIDLQGNTLTTIKKVRDNQILQPGQDYSYQQEGSIVTIKKEFLSNQLKGILVLNFEFSHGFPVPVTVTVFDTGAVSEDLVQGTEILLTNYFPEKQEGLNCVLAQYYDPQTGSYQNLEGTGNYTFINNTVENNLPLIQREDRTSDTVIVRPAAVEQSGKRLDAVVRVALNGEFGFVNIKGHTGLKSGSGPVRFYIYKGKQKANQPIWESATPAGSFDFIIPYIHGEELFFTVDAGDNDIHDRSFWEGITFKGLTAVQVNDLIKSPGSPAREPLEIQIPEPGMYSQTEFWAVDKFGNRIPAEEIVWKISTSNDDGEPLGDNVKIDVNQSGGCILIVRSNAPAGIITLVATSSTSTTVQDSVQIKLLPYETP